METPDMAYSYSRGNGIVTMRLKRKTAGQAVRFF